MTPTDTTRIRGQLYAATTSAIPPAVNEIAGLHHGIRATLSECVSCETAMCQATLPAAAQRSKADGRRRSSLREVDVVESISGSGVACLTAGAARLATPTPWELLGRSLDVLVTDGVLPTDRREGAELKAWSLVHGFASLALAGHAAVPTGRQRHAALESALEFGVLGLCGPTDPQRATRTR